MTAAYFTILAVKLSGNKSTVFDVASIAAGLAFAVIRFINYYESYANHYYSVVGRVVDHLFKRRV